MTTTPELDVRTIPPPQRHPQIFGKFDALGPGEAFVLVNDHNPKPLLYQFQAERAGTFDWSVLEAGPQRFRVEIRRRSGGGARAVTEFLEADHRRLDAIVVGVRRHMAEGAFQRAGERFAEFVCGLNRHIDIEEQILFPAFEKATGMAGGPTVVMRHEHVEIRRHMGEATAALRAGDASAAGEAIDALEGVLGEHNMKEEQILYPMADKSAGDDRARDDLVKRMQAM